MRQALVTDATNKEYVDSVVRGLVVKNPVRLLCNFNVPLVVGPSPDVFFTNGRFAVGGEPLDGKDLLFGDRLLLVGQESAVQNGIYVFVANDTLQRASDLPVGAVATGVYQAHSYHGERACPLRVCR